ncbi:hypothetical protein GPL15_23315 [Clostridium sp. MCC353]|uniref:hypothetical protein n=1 Tax=Clostridium sp. MCC353 TaxID=2592646 RepID=UPI001C00E7AA|nr:hypothetical protein [Clostridium sp. MCC353]MBT9779411.1 hypothetical protein [Clostridium sp. MCC353]
MDNFSVVIRLFAALAVVGTAGAVVMYFLNKNSGKKKEEETTSNVTVPSPVRKTVFTREDCWKKYKQAAYEKKFTQCCKNVFTETSILFYLEKLMTAAHYGLVNSGWEKEKEMISYYINDGLDGALRYRMKDEKGGYGGPSPQNFKPDVDEETYYYQRGMDRDPKGNSQAFQAEYERLEEEIKHHLKDKNTVFYRNLWRRFQPDLKELLEFGKRLAYNTDDGKKMEQEFCRMMDGIRKNMKELGIAFIYDDEADKNQLKEYFQTGERDEKETAVVRVSDHYIYYLGKTDIQMGEGPDEEEEN